MKITNKRHACHGCGANVGCSCQLDSNGLCGNCRPKN